MIGILTQCAACATELGLSSGKKCGRCSTRYCGAACQAQHWKEGGHDNLCKKIKKAGGAEQYNANKKYGEAVAVAAEACAEDTKGQTCYICTQALHWKTKEGLVRGCACRGTAGFAHVSCLAEQAKILVAEAEENNLGNKVRSERFARWYACSLCEQKYHSVVLCALGWGCWKTYIGRPETDPALRDAMQALGNGLHDAKHYEDALSLGEAELSMLRRLGAPEEELLNSQGNLASTYHTLRRFEEAIDIYRVVYHGFVKLNGEKDRDTLMVAELYATSLVSLQRFEEAKALLRKLMRVARRDIGESDALTLNIRWSYGRTLYRDSDAKLDDLREAVATLEDTVRIARRVLGGAHPNAVGIENSLRGAQAALRAREATADVGSLCDAVDALNT